MRLTLLPEGLSIECVPGRSLLESALTVGVPLLHSCRGGSCGACRATWVSGEVAFPAGPGLGLMDDERAAGQLLLCRAHPRSDVSVEVRSLRPAAEIERRRLPCRVATWELLSPDVLKLGLKLPAIEPFRWVPGQSIDLILPDGTQRAYSLASAPTDGPLLELHIARVPNGQASGALFALGGSGALLTLEGPLGGFIPPHPHGGSPLLLVAGGTGYAPLRALLRALIAEGWTRPTRLYFGVRRAADLYADAELRALAEQHPQLEYVPVCEEDCALPNVRRGRVHAALLNEESDVTDLDVYAAGPSPMVAALRTALLARGLSSDRFYADAFG
jgi:CDP-4-dehydro-6-deoxyglucose reductase, E3